ncbi:MAG: EAL domain-containing protein [Hyphomicrobiales bacterium]|nr:EAL domain-containing protein [Hyphomicrobiales bacterium]
MERRNGERRATRDTRRAATPIDEETARRIRGEQVAAIVELTPMSATANLLCAGAVAIAFRQQASLGFLLVWFSAIAVFAAIALRGWRKSRRRAIIAASPRAIVQTRINAVILATAWGVAPMVLLPGSDTFHQLFMEILLTGMIAGGAFGMTTVPSAAIAYVWILVSSGLLAMLAAGDVETPSTRALVVAMWVVYGVYLTRNVLIQAARFSENARNRAELTEKSEVIGLLLNDFHEHGSDWLWEVDAEGRIVDPSRRFCEVAGRHASELSGMPLRALLSACEARGASELYEAMDWYESFRDHVLDLVIMDERHSWSVTGRPVFRANGLFCGYQGVASDITERRAAETRVAFLAETDSVTGLANRAKFAQELDDALTDEQANGRATLFCIDLDRFKTVNDTMGHPVGDTLLAEVGRRLKASVGSEWLVARIGGDEFALLHSDCDRPDYAADAAHRILAAFDQPFALDGVDFTIGASIGIAVAPDDGSTPADLMKSADLALYRAKEEGRDTFRFFETGMDARADRRRRIEQGLRTALDAGQLHLVYQPIVDLGANRVCGFETLVRWRSPEFGAVSPGEFIPIAEESKLIVPIGEWILRTAMREAATWPADVRVSINLSPVQFRNRRLLAVIVDALDESGLTPNRLQVEITESTLLDAGEQTLAMLRDLRTLGVRVALDDFGTGYSSLNYLRRFPFDKIKIDKSFVDDIDSNAQSRAIVRAILELTAALGMATVAEGVEKLSQLFELRALGCEEVQGYVISAAVDAEAVPDHLDFDLNEFTAGLVEPADLELVEGGGRAVA